MPVNRIQKAAPMEAIENRWLRTQLDCFSQFSNLVDQGVQCYEILFTNCIRIVKSAAWSPETSHVGLQVYNRNYRTDGFKKGRLVCTCDVKVNALSMGVMQLYHTNKNPAGEQILGSEKKFLSTLCERLGKVLYRMELMQDLQKSKEILEIRKQQLEHKNIALSELFDQLQREKNTFRHLLKHNVEYSIIPILKKMEHHFRPEYIQELYRAHKDIFSSFDFSLRKTHLNLSPREVEICRYIKNGQSTKEISALLSVSPQTIQKHRFNIRKKLGLLGSKQNMSVYLQSFTQSDGLSEGINNQETQ